MTDIQEIGLEVAERQLDRIMGFFPRIDSKVSALFAIVSGQVAFAAVNLTIDDLKTWWVGAPAFVFLASVAWTIINLYLCAFPHLKGGHTSLVYFKEIAKLTEADYLQKYGALDEGALKRDVMGQVWRNSEIVALKYDYLKQATLAVMFSILPWFLLLLGTSYVHWKLPLTP
ncbi:Pycsar system effector family protein [Mesorhizobium sp. M0435]|uniref:Pycsar system effector family protein n=1 Tax=Mesorhizobium sp. M0435 TaxID=2956944 RepID=UPI00333DCD85